MTPPPSSPKPPRPSVPDANERISQHEEHRHASALERLAQRQESFETWTKGVISGQANHASAMTTHLLEQDIVSVAISRAIGVDEKHLPAGLVLRTLPPPPEDPVEPATKPQRPILPIAQRYTIFALAIILLETIKEVSSLVRALIGGH